MILVESELVAPENSLRPASKRAFWIKSFMTLTMLEPVLQTAYALEMDETDYFFSNVERIDPAPSLKNDVIIWSSFAEDFEGHPSARIFDATATELAELELKSVKQLFFHITPFDDPVGVDPEWLIKLNLVKSMQKPDQDIVSMVSATGDYAIAGFDSEIFYTYSIDELESEAPFFQNPSWAHHQEIDIASLQMAINSTLDDFTRILAERFLADRKPETAIDNQSDILDHLDLEPTSLQTSMFSKMSLNLRAEFIRKTLKMEKVANHYYQEIALATINSDKFCSRFLDVLDFVYESGNQFSKAKTNIPARIFLEQRWGHIDDFDGVLRDIVTILLHCEIMKESKSKLYIARRFVGYRHVSKRKQTDFKILTVRDEVRYHLISYMAEHIAGKSEATHYGAFLTLMELAIDEFHPDEQPRAMHLWLRLTDFEAKEVAMFQMDRLFQGLEMLNAFGPPCAESGSGFNWKRDGLSTNKEILQMLIGMVQANFVQTMAIEKLKMIKKARKKANREKSNSIN